MSIAEPTPPSAIAKSIFRQARFLISAARASQFPGGEGLEIAFAGRSNAGKSSAINRLCDNRKLAKTSKTPGRTRLVNFFALDDKRRLVDLPGYGYAKVPEQMKQEWVKLMESYLTQPTIAGVVIIMDIRHPLKDFDLQMLNWCAHFNVPAHVLLTKADKLKRGAQQSTLLKVRKQLQQNDYHASVQIFSSLKGSGLSELTDRLNSWLNVQDAGANNTNRNDPVS